ncbi:MAG: hypothetical protein AB1485_00230 [Candidatus Thermoplasmatota archaeon]
MRIKTKLKTLLRIPITRKDCTPKEWEELIKECEKYAEKILEKQVKKGYLRVAGIDQQGYKVYHFTKKGLERAKKKYPHAKHLFDESRLPYKVVE